jgi:hypothetical protein
MVTETRLVQEGIPIEGSHEIFFAQRKYQVVVNCRIIGEFQARKIIVDRILDHCGPNGVTPQDRRIDYFEIVTFRISDSAIAQKRLEPNNFDQICHYRQQAPVFVTLGKGS